MIVREPEYVISLKLVVQPGQPIAEYLYRIRRGSRKVADVVRDASIVKRIYDRKGRVAPLADIQARLKDIALTTHTVVTFLVLRDAFDERAALDWCSDVSRAMLLPASYINATKVYKRSDLFEMILDVRQRKVLA